MKLAPSMSLPRSCLLPFFKCYVTHTSTSHPLPTTTSVSEFYPLLVHQDKVSNILNMATAGNVKFELAAHSLSTDTLVLPPQDVDTTTDATIGGLGATEWTELIRGELQNMASGDSLDPKCLSAPRRRHAHPDSASLAFQIASQLYPAPIDSSIPQVIKYEKGMFLQNPYAPPA